MNAVFDLLLPGFLVALLHGINHVVCLSIIIVGIDHLYNTIDNMQ